MHKRPITYKNWDGVLTTENFHFNLTRTELIRLELSEADGLAESLSRIVAAGNGRLIMETFERIVLGSYGVREGARFIKSKALSAEFSQHPAYDVLFMELVTDAIASAAFIRGIIPDDIVVDNPNVEKKPVENVHTGAVGNIFGNVEEKPTHFTLEELQAELHRLQRIQSEKDLEALRQKIAFGPADNPVEVPRID